MDNQLEKILEFEALNEFEPAFLAYEKLDLFFFDNWKYYYFFLWYVLVEEYPLNAAQLVSKYDLHEKLQEVTEFGYEYFEDESEFQFIVGYTMGICAFLFGEEKKREVEGMQLLKKAFHQNPENPIYEIGYYGSLLETNDVYQEKRILAKEHVINKFSGNGLLNEYFRSVLAR